MAKRTFLQRVRRVTDNSQKIISYLGTKGLFNCLNDEAYLKMRYRLKFGKKLNLKNPKTFNEKLQWLKLYDRKPIYTTMVDKYEAKKYIADRIGVEYVIPTLGVWNHFDEIDFDQLPDKFVLKCTHDSGGLVICKDKSKLNKREARKKIEKSLNTDYYLYGREWPYKNVKPRIIAEKYMENESREEIEDFKFFCFEGAPRIMYVSRDSSDTPVTDFYDMNGELLDMRMRDPNSNGSLRIPKHFTEMKQIAEKLSAGIHHLRVDFYEVDDTVFVGELTFFHCGGMCRIYPVEWETMLGDWIELPGGE